KINANHFGAFKLLADSIAFKYNDFWIKQGIFSEKNILRMAEVNLTADLLIAMREGIKSKKQVRKYYDDYEKSFDESAKPVEEARFDKTISTIADLFPDDGISITEFVRPVLFYTLFTTVCHCIHGIPNLGVGRRPIGKDAIAPVRNALSRVDQLFAVKMADLEKLTKKERQFLQDCRRATTDEAVRLRRTVFLVELLP